MGQPDTERDRLGSEEHAERIERAFAEQAAAFEDPRFNRPFATGMEWLFEPLALGPEDLLLDVAAGTGQVARMLAPSVRTVIALDATPAMLAAGRAETDRDGLSNIVFQHGDAARLPFLDASFHIVVCRFAAPPLRGPQRYRSPRWRAACAPTDGWPWPT
ncbi:MAG: class I SAM-dependent methyltransferase [Solirubrobacteraceae bacterium]